MISVYVSKYVISVSEISMMIFTGTIHAGVLTADGTTGTAAGDGTITGVGIMDSDGRIHGAGIHLSFAYPLQTL